MFKITRYIYNSIPEGLSKNPWIKWYTKWAFYLFFRKITNLSYVLRQFFFEREGCEIILINPDKYDNSVKNIPIGLACIASYLEKYGVRVRILDMWGAFRSKILLKMIIKFIGPKIIGISIAVTRQAHTAYSIGKFIKKHFPEIKVVYGGLHAAYFPEEAFEKGLADYVILGEGEIPFLQLVRSLKQKSYNLEKIEGLVYKKRGEIIKNEKGQPVDLDKAPFPAYHLLDMKIYDTDIHILPYAKERAADIMTSRGCINNCAYCSSPFLYRHNIRFKNPKLMVEEIKCLKKVYGLEYFHFHDDDFLLDYERIKKFCELLIRKKISIKWLCLTNVNTLLKGLDLLRKMKMAGCVTIEFGIETADKSVLKKINKVQQTNRLISLSRKLRRYSIIPQYLVMSFNPGETLDSAYKTANLIYKLNSKKDPPVVPYLISHHHNFTLGFLTTIYPGCRLYKDASEEGIVLSKNWDDYHPERVNFIPYSFLNDVPEKIKSLSKDDFFKKLTEYKHPIQVHRINNYKIYSDLKNFKSYSKFLYSLYELCNAERKVTDIHKEALKYYPKNSISYSCVGLRFLAMFGLIRSKSWHSVNRKGL